MTKAVRNVSIAVVSMAIIGLLALAGTASAQSRQLTHSIVCGSWKEMKEGFRKQHGEDTVATGVSNNGRLRVEVLASAKGDTFSVFLVYPEGISCLIASGRGLEAVQPPPEDGDET